MYNIYFLKYALTLLCLCIHTVFVIQVILEELERCKPHIQRAVEMAKKVVAQGSEDEIEGKAFI